MTAATKIITTTIVGVAFIINIIITVRVEISCLQGPDNHVRSLLDHTTTFKSFFLQVFGTVSRDSTSVSVGEDVAGVAAGPGDRLLVSLGKGSSVKLFSGASTWADFASIPKGSAVVASHLTGNSLKVHASRYSRT
jgi:hypothetical protein